MSSNRLILPLEAKEDGNGNKYYIAKLEAPVNIECKDGTAFLIFISEEGSEELQIANMTKPKNNGYKKSEHNQHNQNK